MTELQPISNDGRAMAILAHCSVLFGLPIFAAPLVLRSDRLSLHHAKAACINYILFVTFVLLAMFVREELILLTLLNYVPAVLGVCHASAGGDASRFAFGQLGERIFHQISLVDSVPQLPETER